jgi:hypothetical protein
MLKYFASILRAHWQGLLAWYDCPILTAALEISALAPVRDGKTEPSGIFSAAFGQASDECLATSGI